MNSETNPQGKADESQHGSGGGHSPQSVFLYKDSGIQERTGQVPPWLWAVFAILIIWGIYYLITFWTPPPS